MSEDRETEFTHDGVVYVAVNSEMHDSCQGCAFREIPCHVLKLPSCHAQIRKDRTSKIWVKK